MPIESVVQKFYSFSKPGLKKAIASASREDVAESDKISFSTAKDSVLAPSNSSSHASGSGWALLPKFLISPSNKILGLTFKLIRWQDFHALEDKMKLKDGFGGDYAGSPFTIDQMKRLRSKAYTTGAFDCNAGTVIAGNKGSVYHIDPKPLTDKDNQEIEEELTKDIVALRKKGQVHGFIGGGVRSSEPSRRLNALLASIFKKAGIEDITEIWGRHYGNTTDFIMDAKNRIIYFKAEDKSTNWEGDPILTIPALFKNYERVHLSPWDAIESADGIFTAKDVNSGVKELAVG